MSDWDLDLSSDEHWVQVYDVTLTAVGVPGRTGRYYPIPNHLIPGERTSHILAVGSSSSKAKPTWSLGFYLGMQIKVPGVGTAETGSVPIRLGLNLVRFPPLASKFSLKARIPKWHQEMSITIWEYVGSEFDAQALLKNIDSDLARIEYKIDALNS